MAFTREDLKKLLGPDERLDNVSGELLNSEDHGSFMVERYQLHLNKLESVPALRAYSKTVSGKRPVVIYLHSHGGNFPLGKSEMINGTDYLQNPSFAKVITDMGADAWAIDAWGFEDRAGSHGVKESELFKEFLLEGQTLWGMRLFDQQSLIDYLSTRPEVNMDKIATIGMSMGGMESWWLAALEPRVKIVVDISGQTDLSVLKKYRLLDKHNFYLYVPGMLKYTSTLEIQELIAPRPRLSMVGNRDLLCFYPGPEALNPALTKYYADQGHPDNFIGKIMTGGHQETQEMRACWTKFLKQQLFN